MAEAAAVGTLETEGMIGTDSFVDPSMTACSGRSGHSAERASVAARCGFDTD